MQGFTTKQVSTKTGLSRETLRYYEQVGLLPKPQRGANGYRRYTESDLRRIDFIFKTKSAGFTISEILSLLAIKREGSATGRMGRKIALEKIGEIDRRIKALTALRATLHDFALRCEADGLDEACSLSFYLGDPE